MSISNEVVSATQDDIMRRNVLAIAEMQHKAIAARTLQDRVADVITNFAGSMLFVYVHFVWFSIWILLNIGLIHLPHVSEFDPFPFGLLTMIVSLEAIFLSTFILVSQNRMASISDRRAELDLHVNLLAEQKATKALEILDQLVTQLDSTSKRFNFAPDPEIEALKVSPAPQEVLQVMEEAVGATTSELKKLVNDVVEDITGETEAIRTDMREVSKKVDEVADDVEQIKQQR